MRLVLLSALLILHPTAAVAQCEQYGVPACDGDVTVVRIVQIKPDGSMQGFMAAAHQAWYRSHGFKDNEIVVARVTGTEPGKWSDTEVITYHYRPPGMGDPPGRGDAAWNAYVKLYQENSDIKSQYIACMPKLRR